MTTEKIRWFDSCFFFRINRRMFNTETWIQQFPFCRRSFKMIFLYGSCCVSPYLTHWGRVTHICVSNLTIFVSDNGLSPGRRQAIIWNNNGLLLIEPLGTNFSEIVMEIHTFSFKEMHLKLSSAKMRTCCLSPNVLNIIESCLICNKSLLTHCVGDKMGDIL